MPIPEAYKNAPNAPWEEQEPEPEPDPDAVYEREVEKRLEQEAEHVTGEQE